MQRLFLAITLLATVTSGFCASDKEVIKKILMGNSPEIFAQSIFVGLDSDMPLNEEYYIAIQPTYENEEILVPQSIEDALRQMKKMLPHWYQVGLKKSRGEQECSVFVNQTRVTQNIQQWIWINWVNKLSGNPLKQQFIEFGFVTNEDITTALSYTFCQYIKTDSMNIEKVLNKE
ncbi:hypothetical protein [Glaciecola sp. MF2-115]|uniref:hypothetical protein n=1 Tax=Glaciecola sp. MF2-115 TaxID=3384827 RepID=UPI0039A3D887